MNTKPLIQVKDMVVGHDRKPILPAVSFDVLPGEVWGLIGANGSGKTTLLRTMLALLPPISGKSSQQQGLKIGYVPQRSSLDLSVPSRVIDIVRGGADQGWSFLKPTHLWARADSIERALAEAGVGDLRNVQFAELSEGQKQRVLVARALVSEPELLVLDEPTSAMDITAERAVFELIENVVEARKLAVLLVSHHLPVLGEFATHAVYVDRDAQVIVPGDIQTVCQCRECKSRYGDVLGVLHDQMHEHGPDCDHDHDHDTAGA